MVSSSGKMGTNLVWTYCQESRQLRIDGSGAMDDVLVEEAYVDDSGKARRRTVRRAPWDEYADVAESVEVSRSVYSSYELHPEHDHRPARGDDFIRA